MGDSNYLFPVALKWEEGPGRLKQLKNKLLLYFQSKNKSNGGECEIRDMESSQGYVLIHFREETVRDQVLQRTSHELKLPGGHRLTLSVTSAGADSAGSSRVAAAQEAPQDSRVKDGMQCPAAAPEPRKETGHVTQGPPSNLVLIENVQDTCLPEMLNLLVENISDKYEDIDFYVERIPEISSAVITFTCDIDILSFIRKLINSHRVRPLKLRVKPLEETRSIRAEGLPPNTSEDHLNLYFESSKHGGGKVQETQILPEEEAALVTFCDVQIVKVILAKEHLFGKKAIAVYPYYPSCGIALYGKRPPTIAKPQPLKFPISPYLLEFILKNGNIKQNMDKQMVNKNCELIWPDTGCPNPVITLCFPSTLSTHIRTMAKVVRTWNEEVSVEFSLIISKYKVIDCKMNPSVWETIREHVSSSTYEGVLIKPEFAEEKVYLSGTVKDVNKVDQTFRNMVVATTRQIDRKNQSTTMNVPVSPALYQIMSSSGLEKKILDDVPELKIEYDIVTKNIRLTGLKNEALMAKCEILSVKQQLKSKSIQMNPHINQFLMFADNEELSCLLLVRHNINALVEIEDNVITLTGYSKKDLTEAEEQLKRELDCKQIPVEDKSVLRSPGWKSLQSHLCESFNAENRTVLVQEFPPEAENDVVITGLSISVQKSYQTIHEFLEKNSPMQKTIQLKSLAVLQFIKEEKKQLLDDLKKMNVKVAMSNRNIHLTGTRLYVEQAASLLKTVLSSVYSDTLHIDKPGAKKFCVINEVMHVTMAKNTFKCVIHLQKDGEDETTANEISLVEPQCQIKLPNGVTISVYKGDLCHQNVDVIVNAANEDLRHVGGLALALLKAAGPTLQEDSDRIVKEGKLTAGKSVITDAGNLPCKQVIHTVGPRWNSSSPSTCERLLRKAITSSLELAEKSGHKSIAIPAVSSGIFGFPLHKCVQNIVESIKDYVDSLYGESSISNICLVDTRDETIRAFTKTLKEEFGDQNIDFSPVKRVKMNAPQGRDYKASASKREMTTNENIVIKVREGFIQDATTDVIVNSVGKDLHLESGGASKTLSCRAGKKLQTSLLEVSSGSQVQDGSVFITKGCNLSCDTVIHVVVPQWDGGKGSSEKIFRTMINTCLDTTEKNKMTSITFPAIGTGALGFPRDIAAALMFEEILNFSSKYKIQYIQEVNFMLHPTDTETIKAFDRELTKRHNRDPTGSNPKRKSVAVASDTPQASSGKGPAFFGLVKTPTLGVHEMKIGSITYQVKTGDITKEDTDVIINSTDKTFTLKSGVSKAILEAAGPSVQDECAKLGSQGNTSHIVTTNGNLLCKQILHIAGRNSIQGIKDFVTEALQVCAKLQASSVTFPAIGTGVGSVPPAVVADIILEAVVDLTKSKSSQCIQTVKVVIFQQQMLNDFYSSMKKKEGTDLPKQTSILSKIASVISYFTSNPEEEEEETNTFELRENIEPAVFHLCAESAEAVRGATSWLRDLILKEQTENVITDDWIRDFDEQDHQTLAQIQKKLEVTVSFESPGSTIKISGLTRDVLEMTNKIQDMIKSVRDKKTREREAELCSNLVEWRYIDGTKSEPFDKMTNMELEKAKNEGSQSFTIDIKGVSYTVVMERKSARDPRGNTLILERVPKHEQLEQPTHWELMNNDRMKVVPLNPGSPEYTGVQVQFNKTCLMRIIKIERIQNPHLWVNYQIKKQSIDTKNKTTNNEMQLFHGTDASTIDFLNFNGFNRSYAGKNAACYGNGTYFAVGSNYSAHDTYSKPDKNAQKYMYLARVLTGMSCAGKQGMVAPPAKNPANPTDLYDSVTDNTTTPSMYVIFHDIQAYPEYLITFSK